MDRIIAIDSGVHLCAWAHAYTNNGIPCKATTVSDVGVLKDNHDEGVNALIRQFSALGRAYGPTIVIVEHPVIYPVEKQKGDPNDIVRLAAVGGVVGTACIVGASSGCKLEFVEPRRWKGSVPKDIHNARIMQKHPEVIELVEEIPKGQRHHVWDAVALAFWKAERIK